MGNIRRRGTGKKIVRGYVPLYWDCPECGKMTNDATSDRCSNPLCMWERHESVVLYPLAGDSNKADPAAVARAQAGYLDWTCQSCHAVNQNDGNKANLQKCSFCDTWQEGSLNFVKSGNVLSDRLPSVEEFTLPKAVADRREEEANTAQRHQKWVKHLFCGMIGLAIVLALGWFLNWINAETEVKATVTAMRWDASAEIQKSTAVVQSGWKDQAPTGVETFNPRQEVRDTIQVPDGTYRNVEVGTGQYRQIGTEWDCDVTDAGTGVGKDECEEVAIEEEITRIDRVANTKPQDVYDTKVSWYEYQWKHYDTTTSSGVEHQPRVSIPLPSTLPTSTYRIQQTSFTCRIDANAEGDTWRNRAIPCADYDKLNVGNTGTFAVKRSGATRLVSINN